MTDVTPSKPVPGAIYFGGKSSYGSLAANSQVKIQPHTRDGELAVDLIWEHMGDKCEKQEIPFTFPLKHVKVDRVVSVNYHNSSAQTICIRAEIPQPSTSHGNKLTSYYVFYINLSNIPRDFREAQGSTAKRSMTNAVASGFYKQLNDHDSFEMFAVTTSNAVAGIFDNFVEAYQNTRRRKPTASVSEAPTAKRSNEDTQEVSEAKKRKMDEDVRSQVSAAKKTMLDAKSQEYYNLAYKQYAEAKQTMAAMPTVFNGNEATVRGLLQDTHAKLTDVNTSVGIAEAYATDAAKEEAMEDSASTRNTEV